MTSRTFENEDPHPQRRLWLLLAAPLGALAQGHAHAHGVAKLDIAVDAKQIVVQFETPLDNLVGFERAPRTDSERKRADEAVARLKDGDKMFQFDPAAGCKLARASLDSPALGLGTSSNAAPAKGDHADLFASWEFSCAMRPRPLTWTWGCLPSSSSSACRCSWPCRRRRPRAS
jgi:hypothetical protein